MERQVFVIRGSKAMTTMATKSQHGVEKSRILKCVIHSVTQHFQYQILQHLGGQKHSAIADLCFGKTNQHLSSGEPSKQTSSLTKTHHKELVLKESEVDQVKSAEALWMLKVAESDYSLISCYNIGKLFMQMFPGNVSSQFQFG